MLLSDLTLGSRSKQREVPMINILIRLILVAIVLVWLNRLGRWWVPAAVPVR